MKSADSKKTVKLAIHGLTHGHVNWVSEWPEWETLELVGIVEADTALANQMADRLGLPRTVLYPTMAALLEATEVDAVAAFGNTKQHLETVEFCAPRGVHVMVEKPLATDLASARRMHDLATEHGIHLLTNYETTWMSGQRETARLARADSLGAIRRLVFRTGHAGPVAIGVGGHFLRWLTDPELNGGGALMDFGCYGANQSTYILGEVPTSVFCTTEQLQPAVYPEVEDAATILLTYPEAQVVIQASWNWPHSVKDMDVYGAEGYALSQGREQVTVFSNQRRPASTREFTAAPLDAPQHSPFTYLAAVVRGEITPEPYDLYSLENNLVVMRILQAAKESAASGRVVQLDPDERR